MNLLEVRLRERDDFLKIAETLTRIGFSTKDNKLVQTCHILHKRGKYYICHFKELFELDGIKKSDFTEEDMKRRNGIANLLEQWGLCEIAEKDQIQEMSLSKVKVVSYSKKKDYILKSNYTIGKSAL